MVCKRNHLLFYFWIAIHSYLNSFYATKYFWKKVSLGEKVIEEITEFKSRGMDPLVVHALLQLVVFMTKQKSL